MKKISLLVLCGGQSAEHQISLVSAWNLLNTLDENQFDCQLIAIDEQGNWHYQSIKEFLQQEPHPQKITIPNKGDSIYLLAGNQENKFYRVKENSFLPKVDVVFPLLHGPNGEDGKMQGLLEQLQIPFVGCDVLGSSVCMDKDVAKRLMREAGVPTSNYVAFSKSEKDSFTFELVKEQFGLPLFVKPANMGSSVGINKVNTKEDFQNAVEEAFLYDTKIIIEEFIDGIEVECAVLGNEDSIVSQPGTYVHSDDFFDFDTKYLKNNEVTMQIPAQFLSKQQCEELMELSKKAYKALCCKGLSRVDTFVTKDGRYLVNEINTMPGFTQSSMYPVLMEKTGVPYNDLVKQLCELAMERG